MNKAVILVVLPCLLALVACNYYLPSYGYQQGYYPSYAQAPVNVAPYASYAANSFQAARNAQLLNYLLGGLFFLNLFNVTGNRIAG